MISESGKNLLPLSMRVEHALWHTTAICMCMCKPVFETVNRCFTHLWEENSNYMMIKMWPLTCGFLQRCWISQVQKSNKNKCVQFAQRTQCFMPFPFSLQKNLHHNQLITIRPVKHQPNSFLSRPFLCW